MPTGGVLSWTQVKYSHHSFSMLQSVAPLQGSNCCPSAPVGRHLFWKCFFNQKIFKVQFNSASKGLLIEADLVAHIQ